MAMRLDLGHLLSELLLPLSPGGRKSLCLQVSEDTSFMLFLEWGKSPPPPKPVPLPMQGAPQSGWEFLLCHFLSAALGGFPTLYTQFSTFRGIASTSQCGCEGCLVQGKCSINTGCGHQCSSQKKKKRERSLLLLLPLQFPCLCLYSLSLFLCQTSK